MQWTPNFENVVAPLASQVPQQSDSIVSTDH